MSGNLAEHPARETLAAFGSGMLEPAEAVTVEAHIAECEECCETLHDLGNDTFVDLVRKSNALQIDSVENARTVGLDKADDAAAPDLPAELTEHSRYRVLELLGKGGMGNVYKAEHTLMSRDVALKVINRELVQNPQAVERFRREVKSAAQLAHPNIVAAYDAEQAGDMHLLVMEYVQGDNLADVVKRDGPLVIAVACDYICQAAQGLQHAHQKGMVHRDIKPHNLMVTSDGEIKILDFGLATLTTATFPGEDSNETSAADIDQNNSPTLTSVGSMMGTPDFVSPEQSRDARAADVRSDIYSLGCTLYYLLTGRPPFPKGTALQRIQAHSEQQAESIENVRDDIPPQLAQILRRMMAKDPSERFQTPAEIADALAPFVDAHRTTPVVGRSSDDIEVGKRSWWPRTVVQTVALSAFALMVAGIIYVTTDKGTLEVDAADESVEVIIQKIKATKQGQQSGSEVRIVDTITGTSAKRLPSGEYVLRVKGDQNAYAIDNGRFVLRRGDKVIVRVTLRPVEAGDSRPVAKNEQVRPRNSSALSGPSHSRLLTAQDMNLNHFYDMKPSPDGRQIAYTAPHDDGALFICNLGNLHSANPTKLTDKLRASGPVWSPDGDDIAFQTSGHLRIVNVRSKKISTPANADNFHLKPLDWSADGDTLVCSLSSADGTTSLALLSVTGKNDGGPRPLVSQGWNHESSAMFSRDGQYIAYSGVQDGNRDIFVIAADGTAKHRVTSDPGDDVHPIWAPDGKTLLYTSANGMWAVTIVDGHPQERQFIRDKGFDAPLAWTDLGLFYIRWNNNDALYSLPIDPETGLLDGQPNVLPLNGIDKMGFCAWSPEEDYLAVSAYIEDVIHVVAADGSSVRSFSTGHPRASSIWWSAEGSEILFVPYRGPRGLTMVGIMPSEKGRVRQVLPPRHDWGRLQLSRNGNHLLYYKFPGGKGTRNSGQRQLFVSTLDDPDNGISIASEADKKFGRFSNWVRPKFSRNGSNILFATMKAFAKADIWVSATDGTQVRKVLSSEWVQSAFWGPKGQRIVCSNRNSLFIVNLDTLRKQTLPLPKAFKNIRVMDWSRSGEQIAVKTEHSNHELWLVNDLLADVPNAASRSADVSQPKNTFTESGGGLMHVLSEDGSWVQYDEQISGRGFSGNGTLRISSVGKKVEDGEKCRWIEITRKTAWPGQGETTDVNKFLIPERYLKNGEAPLGHIVRGWIKEQNDDPRQVKLPLPMTLDFMPIHILLPGKLANVKNLGEKNVQCKSGDLDCVGRAGSIEFKLSDRGVDIAASYVAWLNADVPFGVVTTEVRAKAKQNANLMTHTFRVSDYGTGAKSKLPDKR